jgi:uncharacterized protein
MYNDKVIILLHSSKTMRASQIGGLRQPLLLEKAKKLDAYLKTLTAKELALVMGLSASLAEKTHALITGWTDDSDRQSLAVDSFTGDIYSGLRSSELSQGDRQYTDQVLWILSGLYGIIRPYDGICPYRLEMGYKLPDPEFANLVDYWGDAIAACLPDEGPIINLAAAEYSQVVTRFAKAERVITPKFLTVSPKTGQPAFVVVHAKIARGAFARWLITSRTQEITDLERFAELGYRYHQELSSPDSPTYVCEKFEGKGLSIRLG